MLQRIFQENHFNTFQILNEDPGTVDDQNVVFTEIDGNCDTFSYTRNISLGYNSTIDFESNIPATVIFSNRAGTAPETKEVSSYNFTQLCNMVYLI